MEQVNISELKAKISYYLRRVRQGRTVDILDRNIPIARLVPYQNDEEPLPSRRPRRTVQSLSVPESECRDMGSLEALVEERRAER